MDLLKMLKDHKELQDNIKQLRTRNVYDSVISCIAEIIEFNEELGYYSHKTWKQKESTFTQRIEEFVDILFFFFECLELQNFTESKLQKLNEDFNKKLNAIYSEQFLLEQSSFFRLIHNLIMFNYLEFLTAYFKIANIYGFSPEYITEEFYKKLEKNYKRIGKEWR